jgi:hypothetical protein
MESAVEPADYAFIPPPESIMPSMVDPGPALNAWNAAVLPDPAYEVEEDRYEFVPAPETELPLTPEDIDTGEDVYAFALEMAQVEADPGTPGKWETRDDLAAVGGDYALDEQALPAEPEFDFELPGENGLADLVAAAVSPSEMDAIAALYSSLDAAGAAGEPDPAQEEERG